MLPTAARCWCVATSLSTTSPTATIPLSVRAELVRELLLGRRGELDPRGIRFRGARIVGGLDPDYVRSATGLRLVRCAVNETITARDAHLPWLSLDAVLCTGGPVAALPEFSVAGVHRRGHGALYDGLAAGRIDIARLRMALSGLELPRGADRQVRIANQCNPLPRPKPEQSP